MVGVNQVETKGIWSHPPPKKKWINCYMSIGDAPKSDALELKNACPPSHYVPKSLPPELPSPTSSLSGGVCYDILPSPAPSPAVSRRRGSSSPYSLSSLPHHNPVSPFKEAVGIGGDAPPQQLDDYLDSSPTQQHSTFFNGLSQNGGSKGFTLDYEEQAREEAKRRAGTPSREVHNKLEKNRRAHLKECFENLRRQLPCMEDKKISNQTILKASQKYILNLKRKEREYEHEMERLAREKIAHQQQLSQLKKDLQTKWDHIDFSLILPATIEQQKDNQTKSTTTASEQPDLVDEKSSNESSCTSSMMTSSPDSKYKSYKIFKDSRDYSDANIQVGSSKPVDLSEQSKLVHLKTELKPADLTEHHYIDPNQPLNLSLNSVETVTVLPVAQKSHELKENGNLQRNAPGKSRVRYKGEWPHRTKQYQPYYIDDKNKLSKVNIGLPGISSANTSSAISKVSGVNVNVAKVISTSTASNLNSIGSIIASNGSLKAIRNGSVAHISHLVKSATALAPIPTVGKLTVAVSNTPSIRINSASNGTFTPNGIQLQPIGKISANGIGPGLATLSVVQSNGNGVPTTLTLGTLSMSTQQPRLATTIAGTRTINTSILTPVNSSYNIDSLGGNQKGSFHNSIIGGGAMHSPIVTPILSTHVSSIGQTVPGVPTSMGATLARVVPANSSTNLSLPNGSVHLGPQLIASGMQLATSGVQLHNSRSSTVHLSTVTSGMQLAGAGATGIQLSGANGLLGQPTAIQVITPEGYKIIPTDNTVNGKPLAITFAHPDCLDPRALEEGKPLMVAVNKNGLSALHLTVPRHSNTSQSANLTSTSVPLNLTVSGSTGTVKVTQAGTTLLPSYIPITHANGIAQFVPGMSLVGPLVVSQSQRGVTMVPVSGQTLGRAIKSSQQYATTLVNTGMVPSSTPTSVSVVNSGIMNSVVMVSAPHSVQINGGSPVSTSAHACVTMNLKTSSN